MAKKRKTRQEKKIADLRRQLNSVGISSPSPLSSTYALPTIRVSSSPASSQKPVASSLAHQGASSAYTYVLSDLRKTALLTIIALGAQIALHFVLSRG